MYLTSTLFRPLKGFLWLLFFLSLVSNVSANIRVDHCDNCGNWLVGSVYLQLNSIQWVGNQVADPVTIKEVSSPFGLTGLSGYLQDPQTANQWKIASPSSMVIGNASPGGPAIDTSLPHKPPAPQVLIMSTKR
jgi:hypothetical protein